MLKKKTLLELLEQLLLGLELWGWMQKERERVAKTQAMLAPCSPQ